MKNILKRTLSMVLGILTLGAASACKSGSVDSSSVVTDSSYERSGYKVVNRGISECKVVIPEDPNSAESFAASELTYFLKEATGANLSIVSDSEVKKGDMVINLGNTTLAEDLSVTVPDNKNLGYSGYYIKTVGNSLFILGTDNEHASGVLYGVYDWLNDVIGYKAYTEEAIYFEETETIDLYAYDEVVTPTFDLRALGYMTLEQDPTYLRRMRLIGFQSNDLWGGVKGHNQVTYLLPYSTYGAEHPDWYVGQGKQLCWMAGEEMERTFANKLIEYIEASPDAVYFLLGQEDNKNYCTCDRCEAAKAEWAGNASGLQVAFANNVIDIVEEYFTEKNTERDIRFVVYAYQGTQSAPAKQAEDGSYVAYSEKVQPKDNLYIWFAPIGLDYSKKLEHENNSTVTNDLIQWRALLDDRIIVYSYDTNFRNYFINWNNLDTVQSHYKTFKDNGVSYMTSQGPLDTTTPAFEELRIYVESCLMWDVNQNMNDLIKDFLTHYYKDAGDAMYEYYRLTMNRYVTYQAEYGAMGGIYSTIGTSAVWPESIVSALGNCIDDALTAIEPLKVASAAEYTTLKNRIMKQNLTVLYLKLSHYQAYYSEDEVSTMISDFKYYTDYYNITKHIEGGSIDGLFD